MDIIVTLLIGAAAGWLGGQIYKGSSLGLLGNIVVGIVGGFVGNKIFGLLDISIGSGWIGSIITGAAGAIVILFLINVILKK